MTTQPEALRLAEIWSDYLPAYHYGQVARDTEQELRRLHQHELAKEVWQVKTQWVQDTAKPEELGMHRADVMRQRLVRAETQRDVLLQKITAVIAAEQSEGAARGGFIHTPPTKEHHRRVVQAWKELHAAIKAVEGEKG